MKKIFTLISVALCSLTVNAQDVYNAIGDMTIISGTAEETEAQNE